MTSGMSGRTMDGPPMYVVGIGASAGGLEALEQFFDHVPSDGDMAFVVVQHLSPNFKSLMDELLARHTSLPIQLAEDGMVVQPNHVYLMPPKKEMIIAQGRLLLSDRDPAHDLSLPIDVFFRSLAQDCGPRAIAIVLSGGGSDGSRGIRDVHAAGGLVVVQDASAQFNGMPRTARDAGVADFVLAPQDMGGVLIDHVRNAGRRPPTAEAIASPGPEGIDNVYRMLQEEFGLDFNHYKPSTVTRRIERRLQLGRSEDVAEYVERLKSEREELDRLYRDLLIGVTRFFRNPEAFEILEHRVLPDLMRKNPLDMPLRVWVAGCATGEEAYSLAIILSELSAAHGGRPVKIFATDVHPGSIEIAARGVYGEEAVAKVSPERLERYFHRRPEGYQVIPDIRQLVVFAAHNVINDAPFTRMDLVSCRNMLIYLQPAVQAKVLGLFHFALNRGGALFLGPSESAGPLLEDFESVDRHWRIYRKHADVRTPFDDRFQIGRPIPGPRQPTLRSVVPRYSTATLLSAYDALLDDVIPPSFLVNEEGELIHTFAGASKFIKPRDGRQDHGVLDAVDDELRMVLVGGLQRVKRESTALVFRGVPIRLDGEAVPHKVTVRPLRARNRRTGGHVLVSFEASGPAVPPSPAPASETEVDLERISQERLAILEHELAHTKENLQAAIEEMETSNEELQATNEELLASNEELQSTNEELQSVNEELYTVNAEYQRKISELTELTNDMDNLLESTDVGAVFLDTSLNIRKFTPQMAESFGLLPHDVGRSIETFTHRLNHPEISRDLRRVLAEGKPVERELSDEVGRTFFLRILPYRARGAIAGVVITLIDVTGLKEAEDALFHERYLLNSLVTSIPDAIYFKDARGRFIRTNAAMARRLGLDDPRELEGKTALELPNQAAALAMHNEDQVVLRTGMAQEYRLEKRELAGGETGWDLVTRLPLIDRTGNVVGVIGVFRDVTEQKQAEERVHGEVRRRDEFLAMLSHELRNPLGALVSATALLNARSDASEARPKVIQVIERQTQQMSRLLDDLLDAGRVTQNKIELRRTTVDLRAVAHDASDAVASLIQARSHDFSMGVSPRPLLVRGDPARLQQVIVNLLTNAAKYTPPGGRLRLETRAENGHAVVVVRDNGAGIPGEMLDRVFDLFVQADRTLDRSDGGLGVGLTLVRSLVAMHGGSVSARSEGDGKGSEFVVRLPLSRDVEEQPTQSLRRRKLPPGARVAIVEDNPDSRELLCQLLELSGFECRSSDRGDEGLALIREMRPDVAIVDVGLPGIDGFEVARRVRSDPELGAIHLVALTGYGQPKDRQRVLEAGFDAHAVKPIDFERLLELIGIERKNVVGSGSGNGSALEEEQEMRAQQHGGGHEFGGK